MAAQKKRERRQAGVYFIVGSQSGSGLQSIGIAGEQPLERRWHHTVFAGADRGGRIETAWLGVDFVNQRLARRRCGLPEIRLALAARGEGQRAEPKRGSPRKPAIRGGFQGVS